MIDDVLPRLVARGVRTAPGASASSDASRSHSSNSTLLAATVAPAGAADPYDVNVLLSVTGPGAFLGQSEAKSLQAIELIANRTGGINGRPVHFVIADDESSPQLAVQLTNALIAKGVPIMLGPSYSATCYAVLPIVKNGPVQYCYTPSVHTVAPCFTFSSGVSTKNLALAGMRYFRERGLRKLAILVTTDATGQDGENVIKQDLTLPENAGLSLVATEHFTPGDISINAQISRLKSSGAQYVIAWVTGTPFGTVIEGAVDGGLDLPILTNAGNLSVVQMTQYAAFVPKEPYFTGFRFLRHTGPNPTAERVRAYIANLHGFAGINGIMDFRDGQQRGYAGKCKCPERLRSARRRTHSSDNRRTSPQEDARDGRSAHPTAARSIGRRVGHLARHHHGGDSVRHVDADARHDDHQRRAADHPRQPRRHDRRGRVGGDGLHHLGRRRHPAHAVVADALRPAAVLLDRDHRLHDRFRALRHFAFDRRVDPLAHRARHVRRRPHRYGAGDVARYVSEGQDRPQPGALLARRDHRAGGRPDARRLAHR
jgi:branched-chain amino acid transport system substrate-binding protein